MLLKHQKRFSTWILKLVVKEYFTHPLNGKSSMNINLKSFRLCTIYSLHLHLCKKSSSIYTRHIYTLLSTSFHFMRHWPIVCFIALEAFLNNYYEETISFITHCTMLTIVNLLKTIPVKFAGHVSRDLWFMTIFDNPTCSFIYCSLSILINHKRINKSRNNCFLGRWSKSLARRRKKSSTSTDVFAKSSCEKRNR